MLIIFCIAEMSILIPYAQYYLNYDYIAEVLCINKEKPITICYGKCYLNDQLKKTSNSDDGPAPTQIEYQKQPLTLNDLQQYPLAVSIQDQDTGSTGLQLPFQNRSIQTPPPPPPGLLKSRIFLLYLNYIKLKKKYKIFSVFGMAFTCFSLAPARGK